MFADPVVESRFRRWQACWRARLAAGARLPELDHLRHLGRPASADPALAELLEVGRR